MRIYYFFLLIFLSSPLMGAVNVFTEFRENQYNIFLPDLDGPSPGPTRQITTRVSPPDSLTRRLLRNGFNATPGGALRSTVLTLISLEAADYVWDEVTEWWDRELRPAIPYDPSQCGIGMYSQHTVDSPQAGEYIEACNFLGGDVFYPNSSSDYMGCGGIIPYKLNNGYTFDAAINPSLEVQQFCMDDLNPDGDPAIRTPLRDADFADIITSNDPELGVPLINNIPRPVLDDLIGYDPGSGTSRRSPTNATSPNSSRQPTTVTTYDPTTGSPTAQTEWPAFCTWASIVCEFIDWMTQPNPPDDKQDIPTEEIGQPENYDSGLGVGSCPAGATFTIGGNLVTYSMQPACDAMIWFKPILLGMCTLIAGYILIGHKQG